MKCEIPFTSSGFVALPLSTTALLLRPLGEVLLGDQLLGLFRRCKPRCLWCGALSGARLGGRKSGSVFGGFIGG